MLVLVLVLAPVLVLVLVLVVLVLVLVLVLVFVLVLVLVSVLVRMFVLRAARLLARASVVHFRYHRGIEKALALTATSMNFATQASGHAAVHNSQALA